MIFFYFYFYFFLPSVFYAYLTEFTAGFIGILIGFGLDRQIELWKKIRISKQIINNLLVELNNDLDLIKRFKSEIKIPKYHRISPSSPLGQRIKVFDLFQTSAWNILSSRLELDAIEVLYDLGAIYHRFELFNEAIKNESTGGTLEILLRRNRNFLEELENDLEEIIKTLDGLRV